MNFQSVIIRKGEPKDVPAALALIKELAEYERAPDEVEVTESELLEDGFGQNPSFGLFVAEYESQIIGIALYYFKYSTWKGKCVFLEDLVVKESFRRFGAGRLLFDEVVKVAKDMGARRLEWQVLEWNEPALFFYRKVGANLDSEWINGKLIYSQIQNYFEKNEGI
jgi:GNAT superfamily N-acetyltransferase